MNKTTHAKESKFCASNLKRTANDCHSLSQCTTTPLHNASGREKPKRSIFQDCKWRKQKTARFTSKECIPHPWEETTIKRMQLSPPVKHKPGSESLESVACLEESSSFPPGGLISNPKESSERAACLEEKKAALLLFPPQAQNPSLRLSQKHECSSSFPVRQSLFLPRAASLKKSSGAECLVEMSWL